VIQGHLRAVDHGVMDPAPASYSIRINGHLGATMRSAFPALAPQHHGAHTVLTGLLDQSALHGILPVSVFRGKYHRPGGIGVDPGTGKVADGLNDARGRVSGTAQASPPIAARSVSIAWRSSRTSRSKAAIRGR
jgi:hypothetical protein